MKSIPAFDGFSKETVKFFSALAKHNDKFWFEEHRHDFEEHVLAPAMAFVVEMGERLRLLAPNVVANPRVDRSIFRIYRDTRFSRDKRPYKTHLGIFFWEGRGKKMECPGFYFHLEPPSMMIGDGLYMFTRPQLAEYRDSVVHPRHGASLRKAIDDMQKKGPYYLGGEYYKKVPHGYDPKHKNADLLLMNGLYAGIEAKVPPEFYSRKLLDYCLQKWTDMIKLHQWLGAMAERAMSSGDGRNWA